MLASVAFALASSLLMGCSANPSSGKNALAGDKLTFSGSVASTVSTAQSVFASSSVSPLRKAYVPSQEEVDKSVSILNNTIALFSKEIVTVESESDRPGYSSMKTITFDENTYVVYIAAPEVLSSDSSVSTSDSSNSETSTEYHGIVLANEKEYAFTSSFESEIEDQETETENEFKLIVDENSFIKIETGTEIEAAESEVSFAYTIVENGVEVDSFEAEKEIEGEEASIKVTLADASEYDFEFISVDGAEYVEVETINGTFYLLKSDAGYSLVDDPNANDANSESNTDSIR